MLYRSERSGRGGQVDGGLVDGQRLRVKPGAPPAIQVGVPEDAEEPGLEVRAGRERAAGAERACGGFLGQVGGLLGIAGQRPGESIEVRLKADDLVRDEIVPFAGHAHSVAPSTAGAVTSVTVGRSRSSM